MVKKRLEALFKHFAVFTESACQILELVFLFWSPFLLRSLDLLRLVHEKLLEMHRKFVGKVGNMHFISYLHGMVQISKHTVFSCVWMKTETFKNADAVFYSVDHENNN